MQLWEVNLAGSEGFSLLRFGYEDSPTLAKWGRGRRNHNIIHYVLEGKGRFNGHPVEKGMGFLIRAGERAEYHMDSAEPWRYFWISMAGPQAEYICKNHILPDENGLFPWQHGALIGQLLENFRQDSPAPMAALAWLYRILSCHEAAPQKHLNPYVAQAQRLLRTRMELSVQEVAAACKVDDRYLYNLFVKHTGLSPKQYSNALRLQKAQALLKESDCPVSEVALQVGFADGLTFSRFFSRLCGQSPTAYRKANREIRLPCVRGAVSFAD